MMPVFRVPDKSCVKTTAVIIFSVPIPEGLSFKTLIMFHLKTSELREEYRGSNEAIIGFERAFQVIMLGIEKISFLLILYKGYGRTARSIFDM